MIKMKKNILAVLIALVATINKALAQQVEMAEGLRSSGKIYVVVGVICIIFIGIVAYLINLDNKLKKLKNEVEKLRK
jgi:CcmD family protein